MDTKQLFAYVYDRVSENVAVSEDLSDFELGMLYECGDDSIPIADVGVVLAEWFELGDEPYLKELMAGVPPELKTDDAGHERHFYGDDGTLEQNVYEARWDGFVEGVRYKHRYFNADATQFLDSIFSVLVVGGDQLKVEVVRTICPGDLLFRARRAQSQKQAEEIYKDPARQLGPTPKHLASSQRMTPNGISALYCALERETCLSEIRSITGDHVVSAALTPTGELKLLDITALSRVEPPALTLLDEGFRESRHRKVFLDSLVKKMSRPKSSDDELSYLSTQVVFEYLRTRFGKYVDGMVFPSVQTGEVGTNVVMFPEASRLSYTPPSDPDPADGPVQVAVPAENTFGPPAKLSVVAGSMRFHRVTAIETRAKEYLHFYPLFMNDLDRKRIGPYFE
ncbi:RES family NAD+ phosphorylase [Acidovorax sp. 62]|uniref:RES family NAD+ phosphorylase n=1 Tax=Acidovorax sp. 62 TaxID=2035203 RepID=UPI0018EB7C99|nr:RES family NAD+ phosphorylase [Acidovorax sp. 62]